MSEPLFKMRIFGLGIVHERAGVISEEPCWVCWYGYWMHTGDTLLSLLWNVFTEWKNDRHIVG